MQPKTLSASSVHVFELCDARYKASHIDYTPDENNAAASIGTACHAALENYVKSGDYKSPNKKVLLAHFDKAYFEEFAERDRYADGVKMLSEWYERTDLLDGREILSTEQKDSFNIPTSLGDIPFNYIMDRMDRLPNGGIEVVDYKTVSQPIQPEDLKHKIQPRVYAMAAAILYPDAPEIWVTFDLLRFDQVGVRFSREENVETWHYIKSLAERIITSDGSQETLNPECRFCIRKGACTTLQKNIEAGGKFAINTITEAIDRRAQLEYAKGAVDAQLKDLDAFILSTAEREEVTQFSSDNTIVEITSTGRRSVDSRMAARVLGPEIMSRYGTLAMKDIDAILKDSTTDVAVKMSLKALITKKFSEPSVKTKQKKD